ncbi:expressed unknown protein [Seminavis robusta]|uniref:Uncharacterized protein n=1 Tax=Seminavis robusta TaxID=568900 RepID=A0A9N8DIZ7_9STRA|nr:expressed unknown protein [Seminavis robusta]|eukprot:Sro86_g045740.1 n/a (142) ;mRNA; r:55482-56047
MTLDPFNHTAVRRGFIKEEHLEVRERGTLNTIIVIVMQLEEEASCVVLLGEKKSFALGKRTTFHAFKARRFVSATTFWQDQHQNRKRRQHQNIKNKSKWSRHELSFYFKLKRPSANVRLVLVGGCFQALFHGTLDIRVLSN